MIPAWEREAACRDADQTIFFWDGLDEPLYPRPEAKAFCNRCEVRRECLQSALDFPDTVGVWGGTSTYQRKSLKRRRSRSSCPVCGSRSIAVIPQQDGQDELCLGCGLSWKAPVTDRSENG